MKVVFSDRAYTAILVETLSRIKTETGGLFLGYYDNNVWYVIESVDPGPNSIFKVDYFEYDQPYVRHLINKKILLYENKIDLIGLWHRHPGTFDRFSSTDGITNTAYAKRTEYGAISMLVNLEPEFRFTIYHVAPPCIYSKIVDFEVGDELIPDHFLKYRNTDILLQRLNGNYRNVNDQNELQRHMSLRIVLNKIKPLLRKRYLIKYKRDLASILKKNDLSNSLIEVTFTDIFFLSDECGVVMEIVPSADKIKLLEQGPNASTEVYFSYDKKEERFLLHYEGETFIYEDGLIKYLYEENEAKGAENGIQERES